MNTTVSRNLMLPKSIYGRVTQLSYFALLALLIVWSSFLFPATTLPIYWKILAWCLPLLFALPGVLKGKLYTFAWLQFINMLYFCHGVWYLPSQDAQRWLGIIELIFVFINFSCAILAIRQQKKKT